MQKTIFIQTDQDGPRLRFVLGIVFGRLLNLDWRVIPSTSGLNPGLEKATQTPDLSPEFEGPELTPDFSPGLTYFAEKKSAKNSIYASGFLKRNDKEKFDPQIVNEKIPLIFSGAPDDCILPFDIFSAIFYLASNYKNCTDPSLDSHGRYNDPEGEWKKIYSMPIVHHWVEMLRVKLGLPAPERNFDFLFTFDIDQPWKYKNKPLYVRLGGMMKDLIKFNFSGFAERVKTFFGGKDPFDTWEMLLKNFPKEKSRFFFLVGGDSPFDSRFNIHQPAYKKLVEGLSKNEKIAAGLHPSYETSTKEGILNVEFGMLNEIISELKISRQHYLRYSLPSTFRKLLEQGIREEYSLCFHSTTGFPCGLCIPFPFYDLEKEKETELILFPSVTMDRAMMQSMKMNPEEALQESQRLMKIVNEVKGTFVIILHNETLSESGEWKGWRKPVLEILNTAKELSEK